MINRDRELTEKKIIRATKRLIARKGFLKLGVNSIAREAKISKVLIYRYFGSLEGLLKKIILENDYWSIANSIEQTDKTEPLDIFKLKELTANLLIGQYQHLDSNFELRELLRWQLIEKNQLTEVVDNLREENGMKFSDTITKIVNQPGIDINAISSIITSGIYYLVLRSYTTEVYNGIELNTESGKQRIIEGIKLLNEAIFKLVSETSNNKT